MTCIVAIEEDGIVHMGADTQASAGWHSTPRSDGKLFRHGKTVIGFTSSYRMGQIVKYATKPPTALGADLHEAMFTWVDGTLRPALKEAGYTRVDNNREEAGTFIVGWRGRIFCIENDLQVSEPSSGFHAVGCGAPYAMGAMYSLNSSEPDMRANEMAMRALLAADMFSNGVGAPFEFLATEKPKGKGGAS